MKAYRIHVQGIVQAVGFRPFVYRIAHAHNLRGYVRNLGDAGVEIEWREGMKVRDILRAVGFNTESAIAKVNGKVVLEDDEVKDGDFVEVIPVVSGG